MSENKTKFKIIEDGVSCTLEISSELYNSLKNALIVNIDSYQNKQELDDFLSSEDKKPINYLQSNIHMYLYLVKLIEDTYIEQGKFVEKEYTDDEIKSMMQSNLKDGSQS